jgi:hypothetical protein
MQCCIIFTGVIYLKNFITTNWADKETDNGSLEFNIHEQDRAMIRDAIVDAVVHAPELIRQVTIKFELLTEHHIIVIILHIVHLEYN